MNIFKYISLAFGIVESVTAFTQLIAARKSVTGAQVAAAAGPAIDAIQSTFNVQVPEALVTDVSQSAADAIDKYVFGV
jgi:hypothetical protein